MGRQKQATDPWERLEQLVKETNPEAPENSFTVAEVAARKGWTHGKAYRWLREQVKLGKLSCINSPGGRSSSKYFFPES